MLGVQSLGVPSQPPPLEAVLNGLEFWTRSTRGRPGPGGGPRAARVRTTLMELDLRPATPSGGTKSAAGGPALNRPASRRWLLGVLVFQFLESRTSWVESVGARED